MWVLYAFIWFWYEFECGLLYDLECGHLFDVSALEDRSQGGSTDSQRQNVVRTHKD